MTFAIQCVLLKKKHFQNRTTASKYIRKNKWHVNVPNDIKEDNVHFRYRQRNPEKFDMATMSHKKINPFTTFILGELK